MTAFGVISSQRAPAKAKALARLRQEMQQALPERRLVFGEGNPDARVVIVGEAPGRKEEALGRPFVGRAGQLLNQLLAEIRLDRGELWITNVVKSRSAQNSGGQVRTRTPSFSKAEMDRVSERFKAMLKSAVESGELTCRYGLPAVLAQVSRGLPKPMMITLATTEVKDLDFFVDRILAEERAALKGRFRARQGGGGRRDIG